MYVNPDFKTKKELKEAVKSGKLVTAYQPGGIFPSEKKDTVCVEGPHYPKPHTWYATVLLKGDVVVKVIG